MTDLNDLFYTDGVDDVLAVYVNRLLASTMRSEHHNVETLSGNRALMDADMPIQRFNCNGASRKVFMPDTDVDENHPYLIINDTGAAYTLTVRDNADAATLGVLSDGQALLALPDGAGEYVTQILSSGQYLQLTEQGSNPSAPGAGQWRLFFKSDGLYVIDDAGNVQGPFGTGGGGAWGDITGTLSDQTDLNDALNARLTKDADNQIAIGTQYTVADDAATSFTPMTTAGLILIQSRSAPTTNYLLSFYVTSAGGSFSPTYAIGSNTVVTTGALTGTTGTDGKLTLSVNTSDGKIYIENRTGASRNIMVKIW